MLEFTTWRSIGILLIYNSCQYQGPLAQLPSPCAGILAWMAVMNASYISLSSPVIQLLFTREHPANHHSWFPFADAASGGVTTAPGTIHVESFHSSFSIPWALSFTNVWASTKKSADTSFCSSAHNQHRRMAKLAAWEATTRQKAVC